MRHVPLVALPFLLIADTALAEDSIVIYGNYYKERSTRVYEPMFKLQKELPEDVQLGAELIIDQISSASGAFTATDEVFSEVRTEGIISASKKMNETVTPGINLRASYEPDYTSTGAGGDVALSFGRETSTLRFFGHFQYDWIALLDGGEDNLATGLIGSSLTQILTKEMLMGISLEARVLRGYQENQYRRETHPRERNRYTASIWVGYFIDLTNTALRASYRLHECTWKVTGHALDFELTQELSVFRVVGRIRYYTQDDAYFVGMMQPYNTMDPKLMAFHSTLYGVGFSFPLSFMSRSGIASLGASRVEPMYQYLDQTNTYGPAHIAQLGWHWPF